jgi:hypothetical protein
LRLLNIYLHSRSERFLGTVLLALHLHSCKKKLGVNVTSFLAHIATQS